MKSYTKLESFLNRPWAINVFEGLKAYASYEQNVRLLSKSPEFAKELLRQRDVSASMALYSMQGIQLANGIQLAQGNSSKVPTNSIAVIPLIGTMMSEDGLCTYGIDYTINQINQAKSDPNIMGVILRTNSGGGEVVAAQKLANAIIDFKAVKPIVQYIDGMSASGAVFAGVNTNEIVAGGKTANTGSIGVVIEYDKEWLEMVKENYMPIYSDYSPDKHDTFNALLNGDSDLMKKRMLNPIAKEFQNIVRTNRAKVSEETLTGKMFFAQEGKKLGLIDHIGTFNKAIDRLRILSNKKTRGARISKARSLAIFK